MAEEQSFNIPGYTVQRVLGEGGMAKVYLAIQDGFDRPVALKVLSPTLAADDDFGRRFIREARIVGNLTHSNIVPVYDVGEVDGLFYLSMEILPGGDLTSKIKHGITIPDALNITRQIAKALKYAHDKGFIHRDVKPDNVLFRDDGTAVLTDFGIARTEDDSGELTQVQVVIGSPKYMSPEQAMGKHLDARTDIYSLGVMLYQMLTGTVPFGGKNVAEISIQRANTPSPPLAAEHKQLQSLMNKILAYSEADRFQSCAELLKAIDENERNLECAPTAEEDLDKTVIFNPAGSADGSTSPSATKNSSSTKTRSQQSNKKSSPINKIVGVGITAVILSAGAYYYINNGNGSTDQTTAVLPAETKTQPLDSNNISTTIDRNPIITAPAITAPTTTEPAISEPTLATRYTDISAKEFYAFQEAVQAQDPALAEVFIKQHKGSVLVDIIKAKVFNDQEIIAVNQAQADSNDPLSALIMSELYDTGWGVETNKTKAVRYAKTAASTEQAFALYQYAVLLLGNNPSEADSTQAVELLEQSAALDFFLAQTILANEYFSGAHVTQDTDTSIQLFKSAAAQGDRNALFNLGQIYLSGSGLDAADKDSAAEYFQKAKALGHPSAADFL